MKLYKRSERTIDMDNFIKAMKVGGLTVKRIGEYLKWKEVYLGKVCVSLTIYEIAGTEGKQGYVLKDTLGKVACQIVLDKQEVLDWLKEHGYKTDKQWYLEDYGMDEETWEEWNK